MAKVDPADDNPMRYVVRRYAYDPDRHERRHQVVAFDNEREFMGVITAQREQLDRRRAGGEKVHPLDYFSGVVLEPGYRRRSAIARLAWQAIGRRAHLSDTTVGRVAWDQGVGFFWSGSETAKGRRRAEQ